MVNNPIYEPKGKAKEYGDLALNIYTGCSHGCFYCVDENAPVLTAEMRSVPIKDIEIGDKIIGVQFDGKYRRLVETTVLNKFFFYKGSAFSSAEGRYRNSLFRRP